MPGKWPRQRRRRSIALRVAPVLLGVVTAAVVVVLVVGAASQVAPASNSYRKTVDVAYASLAGPLARQSDALGARVGRFLHDGSSMSRVDFFASLDSLASSASDTADEFDAITPPAPQHGAGAVCSDAISSRSKAVSEFRDALEALLGGSTGNGSGAGDEPQALGTLEAVGTRLQAADGLWARCRVLLRSAPGSAILVHSVWLGDSAPWSQRSLESFVTAIESSNSLAARPALEISSVVTTQPSSPSAGVLLVTPATALSVNVLLEDQGNVTDPQIAVGAQLTPSGSGPEGTGLTHTDEVSRQVPRGLQPGSAIALTISGLQVSPGNAYTLQVVADSTNARSAVVSLPLQVEQAVSTTLVLASSSQVVSGQQVTYSAQVTSTVGGLGEPLGTVTFEDDGSAIPGCSSLPVTRAKASCSVSYPAPGVHAVTALYSGDQNRSASTSAPWIEKISAAPRPRSAAFGGLRGGGRTSLALASP